MREIKKIDPLSVGKLFAIMYAIMGVILGAIFTLLALVNIPTQSIGIGALFGVGAIIFLPIFYGIMGFVGGVISAWIYNLIAGWVGGIKIELK